MPDSVMISRPVARTAAAEIQELLDSKYIEPAYPEDTLRGFVEQVEAGDE